MVVKKDRITCVYSSDCYCLLSTGTNSISNEMKRDFKGGRELTCKSLELYYALTICANV